MIKSFVSLIPVGRVSFCYVLDRDRNWLERLSSQGQGS